MRRERTCSGRGGTPTPSGEQFFGPSASNEMERRPRGSGAAETEFRQRWRARF